MTKHEQSLTTNPDDIYGILAKETEVDTDVNEDPNRERLLDDALDAFLEEQ
jgi:hypothetical protein